MPKYAHIDLDCMQVYSPYEIEFKHTRSFNFKLNQGGFFNG